MKVHAKTKFTLPDKASMKIPEMRELDELILAGKGDEPRIPVEALDKRAGVN